jgi:hypothetical protein
MVSQTERHAAIQVRRLDMPPRGRFVPIRILEIYVYAQGIQVSTTTLSLKGASSSSASQRPSPLRFT